MQKCGFKICSILPPFPSKSRMADKYEMRGLKFKVKMVLKISTLLGWKFVHREYLDDQPYAVHYHIPPYCGCSSCTFHFDDSLLCDLCYCWSVLPGKQIQKRIIDFK